MMKRVDMQKMLYIALFAALMAVSAWIAIPTPVPFTLQTFTFFLALMLLGGSAGMVMSLIYISLGIIGMPVFASFGSGVGYILSASGGFVLAFPIAAFLFYAMEKIFGNNNGKKKKIIFSIACLAIIYLFGALWFSLVYAKGTGFIATLTICVLPYVIPDGIKILLAWHAAKRLSSILN